MAKTAKTPKKPKSDPAQVDPFAETAATPTPARRRPGRRSNLERDPFAGPIPSAKKKTTTTKKDGSTPKPGTLPANIYNRDDLNKQVFFEGNIDDDIKQPALLDDIEEFIKELESKEKLTIQELKFIEYHLVLKYTVKRSMMLAGYRESSEGMYFYRAKKIVGKFEARAADHRQIMRALGAGEVFVISGMFELAKKAGSEIVKKGALDSLAKWLDMDKERLQGSGGVTVIIQALDGAQQQVNVGTPGQPALPPHPSYQHPQPGKPGQPITITD